MKNSLLAVVLISLSTVTGTVLAACNNPGVQVLISACRKIDGTTCPPIDHINQCLSVDSGPSGGLDLSQPSASDEAYAYDSNIAAGPDCSQSATLSELDITVYNNTNNNITFKIATAGTGRADITTPQYSITPNNSFSQEYITNIVDCPVINFTWQNS